ncbi:hypothetical protein MAR_022807 [Mya arenaria]|uniref:Terpene utilization protein AtuA n=1 Tax=Mya arenaria TaxID=6604 RepID=A0ABY7DPE6_MYAAR|nr:hypothetical protein MAR_022807 [Mya arenaria]
MHWHPVGNPYRSGEECFLSDLRNPRASDWVAGTCPCMEKETNVYNEHSSEVEDYTGNWSNTVRIGCASGFWGDTMTADYLSEITMSLLTAMKNKDSNAGYPVDFVQVISNAGGVNPEACAAALQAVCSQAGIDLNIAVVNGDDLVHRWSFHAEVCHQAGPISRALDLGADIIVTGRCVDSALVLAPLVHKSGWSPDRVWSAEDGNFVVTKPPKTGGIVSKATVAEQLLYEIGDPACYQLPDVNCDFTQVSATYMDGYRMTAVCCVGGPRSKDKAERTAEAILKRTRAIFKQLKMADFSKVNIEILGSENNYGHNSKLPAGSREAVLWLAVHHPDKRALNILAREIAPAGTGMAPGLTGIVGGRPKVSPVLKLFSFLHDKDDLKIDIAMNGKHVETYTPPKVAQEGQSSGSPKQSEVKATGEVHIGQALTEVTVAEYFAHLLEADKGAKVDRYECPGIHGLNFVLHEALGGGGIASLRSDPQGKAYGQMMLDFEIHDMPALVDIINES